MFSPAAKEAEECSMLDRPNGPLKLGLRSIRLTLKYRISMFFFSLLDIKKT